MVLCRELKLFSQAVVAIDGSKFKAVNKRERNYTSGKIERRQREIEQSIQLCLDALETADCTQPVELQGKTARLQHKIAKMRRKMRDLREIWAQLLRSLTSRESATPHPILRPPVIGAPAAHPASCPGVGPV